jgi:PhnB protein
MGTKPIPEGYHSVIPVLAVDDAAAAIEFWKRAFGGTERSRMDGPDGRIAHAEIAIGDSLIMTSDQYPQSSTKPPKEVGAPTSAVFLYVEDVDSVVQDAVDAGAEITMPVEDMFWGDRFGQIRDPFGHFWQIATHVEDIEPEEMERRAQEAMASMG